MPLDSLELEVSRLQARIQVDLKQSKKLRRAYERERQSRPPDPHVVRAWDGGVRQERVPRTPRASRPPAPLGEPWKY